MEMDNRPNIPDRSNLFQDMTSSLLRMFGSMDKSNKETNTKLDTLVRQMIMYYKLLEKSYNKGSISSKQGKFQDLNDDKGFLKLISIMTKVDDTLKNTLDKYTMGQRLLLDEKNNLSKFVLDMKDALLDNKQQIGLPLNEVLVNFKQLLTNDKMDNNFKGDLIKFLKDYTDEDIAVTSELKDLLKNSHKSDKLTDNKLLTILNELGRSIEYFQTQERGVDTVTFAPHNRMFEHLSTTNVSLDNIVGLLTDNQRSGTGNGTGGGRGGDNSLTSQFRRYMANMAGEVAGTAVDVGVKYSALKMADNPSLRGGSAALFASSEALGRGAKSATADLLGGGSGGDSNNRMVDEARRIAERYLTSQVAKKLALPALAVGATVAGGAVLMNQFSKKAGEETVTPEPEGTKSQNLKVTNKAISEFKTKAGSGVNITSISGGKHTKGSGHYRGVKFDAGLGGKSMEERIKQYKVLQEMDNIKDIGYEVPSVKEYHKFKKELEKKKINTSKLKGHYWTPESTGDHFDVKTQGVSRVKNVDLMKSAVGTMGGAIAMPMTLEGMQAMGAKPKIKPQEKVKFTPAVIPTTRPTSTSEKQTQSPNSVSASQEFISPSNIGLNKEQDGLRNKLYKHKEFFDQNNSGGLDSLVASYDKNKGTVIFKDKVYGNSKEMKVNNLATDINDYIKENKTKYSSGEASKTEAFKLRLNRFEDMGDEFKGSGITNIPPEISEIPKNTSNTSGQDLNNQSISQVPPTSQNVANLGKTDRQLKSDNNLINLYNDYGDVVS